MGWRKALAAWCAAAIFLTAAALAAPRFSDTPEGSWYTAAIGDMARRGLLEGDPEGTFRPDDAILAGEFVAVTARCAALAPEPDREGHWAAGYLAAALRAGWYDWDELPPTGEGFDRPIRRQLAVKILMRALFPAARGDYNTESAKIRDFSQLDGRYYEPVLAAYAMGLVEGDEAGNFAPRSGLSRAEAAMLLYRALALREGKEALPPAGEESAAPTAEPTAPPAAGGKTGQGGVSENGWLQVKDGALCNEAGERIVLRGMSSHGLQWYGQYAQAQAIANTAQWGANVFRVAMYTAEGGYLSAPEEMERRVTEAVDGAIENDMYVIIDWHILSDGDPMAHRREAEEFFSRMAARYREVPNVLYEICNEPNGAATWEGSVKPYAQALVAAIRAEAPRGVILVGSSTWSQDLHLVAQSPLEGEDILYTLHFYAGTHGKELRERIDRALEAGLGVFVSEWGTSRADGSGGVFLEESAQWLDFLAQRGISWCNWSLCDKGETSAALRPGTGADGPWGEEDLTDSGRFVFSLFR